MPASPQHRSFRMWLCVGVLASAVACGSHASTPTAPATTSSSAPASPSATNGSATISGTVLGISSTASLIKAQRITLTVTVSGTTVASSVDDNGRFTLTGVPAGTIDLHFMGTGVDAHLRVDGVAEHATLVITVRVNGNDAHVEDNHPGDDDNDGEDKDGHEGNDAEVNGTIAAGSLSGSCAANSLAFAVGTTKVKTNASTQFKDTSCAALKTGDSVEVKGARQTDASVLATRVERKK